MRIAWTRTVIPSLQHRTHPLNVTLLSVRPGTGKSEDWEPAGSQRSHWERHSQRVSGEGVLTRPSHTAPRVSPPAQMCGAQWEELLSFSATHHPPPAGSSLCPQEPVSRTDAGSGAEGLVGGPPVPTLPCRLPPTQLSSPASSCSHAKPRFSLCWALSAERHAATQLVSGTHT